MKNATSEKIFTIEFIKGLREILYKFPIDDINRAINLLKMLKQRRGRLFILGVGGSAANCSHAVNDFRKICHIESYTPNDNIAELTARINDDGWESIYTNWLKVSNLTRKDIIIILSVGGGNEEKNISANIVHALKFAKQIRSKIIGIVSRDGGFTKKVADVTILIPVQSPRTITAYAESSQSVILHAIVNHPNLSN